MSLGAQEIERRLHAARPEALEPVIMALALEATGARHGALFLYDRKARGLALVHHIVEGVTVTLPEARSAARGERAGIAQWVLDHDTPYLCKDSAKDPHYTRYLLDVGAIAAVPIHYQRRAIGVISVSSRQAGSLGPAHLAALEVLAQTAAPFVRRVQLDRQSREETGRPFLIKGLSPAWREIERRLELAAPTEAPILVRGESGTGKDLVARAVHFNSRRMDGPFVTVNCAAIPETLLESLLFGHVRGAFTGAAVEKIGEFQKADGGTLFLDELGELPVMLQAKVLRAVEQGEVQPLGSNAAPERVDVRLIGATNRDLEAMVAAGTFRQDLYYRLSVMTLELPPLRTYKDNLELLAAVFAEQAALRHKKKTPRWSAAAMARLTGYDWPGNVRELKNTVEHAVILCTGEEILPEHLPKALGEASGAAVAGGTAGAAAEAAPAARRRPTLKALREEWLAPLERKYLVDLLAEHGGHVRKAAAAAGIDAVTFYRLLKKRGVTVRREARVAD